jgi:phosphoglycerate dehydrogenase-like enzyme
MTDNDSTRSPARTVLLTRLDSPLAEPIADRHPELHLVDLVAGEKPRDDVEQILLTGPHPPNPDSGWRSRADGARWVHFGSAGIDNFPRDWLFGRTVTCSRGVNSAPIAEFVLGLILSAEKRLPELWGPTPAESLWSNPLGSLESRTVGLIGLGSIGTAVTARLRPFGARIVAVRRSSGSPVPTGVEVRGCLEDVLAESEHLVVAAPLTPATHHLLDSAAFARIRPGAHLINVSRGGLIDHDALLAAVRNGIVGRASLDVTEPEPLPEDHPLRQHANVYLTPHVSWSGPGTQSRALDLFSANLRRWRDRQPLLGLVDVAAGY